MESGCFDILTRSLFVAGSRRQACALALGGALAPLLIGENAAAHNALKSCKRKSGKQKKQCLKKAKKHNAAHANEAPPPPCQGQPDNTPCNGDGRCLTGVCNPKPTCFDKARSCSPMNESACCSETCPPEPPINVVGECSHSEAGKPCYTDASCNFGDTGFLTCVGYRCR